jgi:hypothetical protein
VSTLPAVDLVPRARRRLSSVRGAVAWLTPCALWGAELLRDAYDALTAALPAIPVSKR